MYKNKEWRRALENEFSSILKAQNKSENLLKKIDENESYEFMIILPKSNYEKINDNENQDLKKIVRAFIRAEITHLEVEKNRLIASMERERLNMMEEVKEEVDSLIGY